MLRNTIILLLMIGLMMPLATAANPPEPSGDCSELQEAGTLVREDEVWYCDGTLLRGGTNEDDVRRFFQSKYNFIQAMKTDGRTVRVVLESDEYDDGRIPRRSSNNAKQAATAASTALQGIDQQIASSAVWTYRDENDYEDFIRITITEGPAISNDQAQGTSSRNVQPNPQGTADANGCGRAGDVLTVCWHPALPTTVQNEPAIAEFMAYTRSRLIQWCTSDRCNAYPVIEIEGESLRVDSLHNLLEQQVIIQGNTHTASAQANEWMQKTEIRKKVDANADSNKATVTVKLMTAGGTVAASSSAPSWAPLPPPRITEAPCGANEGYFKVCFQPNSTLSAHGGHWSSELREWLFDHTDEGVIAAVAVRARDEKEGMAQARGRAVKEVIDRTEGTPESGVKTVEGPFFAAEVRQIPVYVFTKDGIMAARDPFSEDPLGTVVRLGANSVLRYDGDLDAYDIQQWEGFKASVRSEVKEEANKLYNQTRICAVPLYNPTEFTLTDQDVLKGQIKERYSAQANDPQQITLMPECSLEEGRRPIGDLWEVRQPCTTYLLVDRTGAKFVDEQSVGTGGTHVLQSKYCGITPRHRDISRGTYGEEEVRILQSAQGHTRTPDPLTLMKVSLSALNQQDEEYALALANYTASNFSTICQAKYGRRDLRDHCYDSRDRAALPQRLLSDMKVIEAQAMMTAGEYEDAVVRAEEGLSTAHPHFQGIGASIAVEASARSGDCRTTQTVMDKYRSELRAVQRLRSAQELVNRCALEALEATCEELSSDNERSPFNTHIVFVNDGLPNNTFVNAANTITQRFLLMDNIKDYKGRLDFSTMDARASMTSPQSTERLMTPKIDYQLLAQAKTACKSDMVIVLSANNFMPVTVNGAGFVSVPACGYDESRPGSTACLNIYTARSIGYALFRLPVADETVLGRITQWGEERKILERFNTEQRDMITDWFGGRR